MHKISGRVCESCRADYAFALARPQAKASRTTCFAGPGDAGTKFVIGPAARKRQAPAMLRLGVLGSGKGSNMQAILEAIREGRLGAEIVLVLSDEPEAPILDRAREAGIPTGIIDCRGYAQKFPEEAQRETAEALQDAGADLICLAGFMRLVKEPLLEAFPDRILNIHPSLLPAYPGLHAWEQAIADGATESGCTVHYVNAGMDTGAIIAQARVPVRVDDTPSTLHARIQEQEHQLYPEAIKSVAQASSL